MQEPMTAGYCIIWCCNRAPASEFSVAIMTKVQSELPAHEDWMAHTHTLKQTESQKNMFLEINFLGNWMKIADGRHVARYIHACMIPPTKQLCAWTWSHQHIPLDRHTHTTLSLMVQAIPTHTHCVAVDVVCLVWKWCVEHDAHCLRNEYCLLRHYVFSCLHTLPGNPACQERNKNNENGNAPNHNQDQKKSTIWLPNSFRQVTNNVIYNPRLQGNSF